MNAVPSIGHQVVALCEFQIPCHHLRDKFVKADFRLPTQLGSGLGCIARERFNLCRTKIVRIDCNNTLPSLIPALLIDTMSAPSEIHSQLRCSGVHELAHGVLLPRRNHVVIRFILLKHEPLHFYIVPRVAPVAFRIQIA